jgi:hypothetical protein
MSQPLDDQYLEWLYAQVASVKQKNPSRSYWTLMRQLYTKEYIWLVPNDDNRMQDGLDLRLEFMDEDVWSEEWMSLGCSMLELFIGLSRRLAFEAEGEARDWFWQLLNNLDLSDLNDHIYHEGTRTVNRVDRILDNVIWRTYNKDGSKGLFPLKHPDEDQRDVEIWYQMSAYLLETD